MKVEILISGDPLVLLGRIPASCKSRDLREHEAGLHLLQYGVNLLGFDLGKVEYNSKGKPYFVDAELPYFNISHSHGLVICAFSKKEVGCDIEFIRRVPKILNRELKKIKNASLGMSFSYEVQMTYLWTIYEAIAKCDGIGIPIEQDEINCKEWAIISRIVDDNYVFSTVTKRIQ